MVRSGELANRLTALQFGADLVWTPEYIDKKIITTVRRVDLNLGLVEYVLPYTPNTNGMRAETVFRTLPSQERGKLVFQLGSSDPELAVEAALKVVKDVDGIDLNCGCPKSFSTHAGMGQALLAAPKRLCSILKLLVKKVGREHNIPISCKIRWLDSFEDSQSLIEQLCDTGISNLTIHCRTRNMRNRESPHFRYLKRIVPMVQARGISLIVNGNLQSRRDFYNMQIALGNNEVGGMIAECAECNWLLFGPIKSAPLAMRSVLPAFFANANSFSKNFFSQAKFLVLNQMVSKSQFYKEIAKLKTYAELSTCVDRIATSDEQIVTKIFLKDCQKQRLYTEKEYDEFIRDRALKWISWFLDEDNAFSLKDSNEQASAPNAKISSSLKRCENEYGLKSNVDEIISAKKRKS